MNALAATTIPATFVSHRRNQRKLNPRFALLKINNVTDSTVAQKYVKNAVSFFWKNKDGEVFENSGMIRRTHGNKGIVRAVFEKNLAPQAVGQTVYVKLYKLE